MHYQMRVPTFSLATLVVKGLISSVTTSNLVKDCKYFFINIKSTSGSKIQEYHKNGILFEKKCFILKFHFQYFTKLNFYKIICGLVNMRKANCAIFHKSCPSPIKKNTFSYQGFFLTKLSKDRFIKKCMVIFRNLSKNPPLISSKVLPATLDFFPRSIREFFQQIVHGFLH